MRALPAAAAAVALLASSTYAADELRLEIAERELANGLRVLVHEDHDVPNVALYVVWKVGSRNEVPGITGIAHFFEHMMFTGGAKYGKSFDPTMEAAGGSNNAYTSNDVTVYQDWFPSSQLELILDMEADRMSGMVFDPEVVESERGVVASERRLSMEEPAEVMREQLWATAFTAHPYQWSVLGWMVDIQNWKKSDLERFFDVNYAPNNCTLIVVGAVRAPRVFEHVEAKMGRLERRPERRPIHTQEPPQPGERRVTVEAPGASLAQVMAAWHIPETGHPDFAVVDVLEKMLLVGESSRLHRLLVEDERLCLSVGGGWQGLQFDPSLFAIEMVLRAGVPTQRAEDAVYAELQRLTREGPDAKELRKVKNGLKAALFRRMKTIDGKADLIADIDTFFGGWQKLPDRLKSIEAVTADDVKRVLSAHFVPSNRTVCTLALAEPDEDEK